MSASLTYRNSAPNSSTFKQPNGFSSLQDVSVPRRRPPDGLVESSGLSSSSSVPRKRPRSVDSREGVGEAKRSSSSSTFKGERQHSTTSSSTQSSSSKQQKIHSSKKSGDERSSKSERIALVNSSSEKAARRSSMESTTSTTTSSGSGSGFRRLKKFSPDKTKKNSSSSNVNKKKSKRASAKAKEEDAETFEQTQLRLWKEAQERHQKLQEEEEKKRLKRLKKQKLREQLQQERLQKQGKLPVGDTEPVPRKREDTSKDRESMDSSVRKHREDGESKEEESKLTTDERKKSKKQTTVEWERKGKESSEGLDNQPRTDITSAEDRAALKAKKRLKKMKRASIDSIEIRTEGANRMEGNKEERDALKTKKKLKKVNRDSFKEDSLNSSQQSIKERERATEFSVVEEGGVPLKVKKKKKKLKQLEKDDVSWSRGNDDRESHERTSPLMDDAAVSAERESQSTRTESMSGERADDKVSTEGERISTDEQEALQAKKKLKRLKKFRRASESGESTSSTTDREESELPTMQTTTTTTTSTAADGETLKKKKKKRRLMKMGSIPEEDELPRKKKKKISAEDSSLLPEDNDSKNAKPKKSNTALETDAATPSTSHRKPTIISSFEAAPLTPLSLGLADTVKTRVRSPTKARDQLELLQAASFEKKKKKRKKNKEAKKATLESSGEHPIMKKKKKKKKQLFFMDSHVADTDTLEALPKKKKTKRDSWSDYQEQDVLYDADVEEKTKPKAEQSIETMSDVAPSEASSSTTVVTGKFKKKRLQKFGSKEAVSYDETDNDIPLETKDILRAQQPLPLKKRMAMAAAAAESASYERHATASTVASKVSLSSASTGLGANPEFGTEASSISEFTHPLGSMALPHPPPSSANAFHRPSSVPREILSKPPVHPSTFEYGVNSHDAVMGPTISSSDDSDSDSSSDSDTDEEELFSWANKMFGTSAKPAVEEEQKAVDPVELNPNLTPEMCDMERRRQKQEEAKTLSVKEAHAILQEEQNNNAPAMAAGHWVRRSVRQPSAFILNTPLVRRLLDKLRGNDAEMQVLKMKKYISDPDTPSMVIDTALEALEECTNCEALYIQNFNVGMKDKQVLHLLRILQMPNCHIWCLNIGETYNVTEETWEAFAEGLKRTKVTHMYASEHTITAELKDEIRETIRCNRQKHSMHNDPNNLDVIVQCTHCWWNPINAKVLSPYLRKRGFESLLNDKEAQGLRGSVSEAPAL